MSSPLVKRLKFGRALYFAIITCSPIMRHDKATCRTTDSSHRRHELQIPLEATRLLCQPRRYIRYECHRFAFWTPISVHFRFISVPAVDSQIFFQNFLAHLSRLCAFDLPREYLIEKLVANRLVSFTEIILAVGTSQCFALKLYAFFIDEHASTLSGIYICEKWLAFIGRPCSIWHSLCSNDVDTGNRRCVLETQSRFTHDATTLPRKKRRHVYVHATEGCAAARSPIYSRFILFAMLILNLRLHSQWKKFPLLTSRSSRFRNVFEKKARTPWPSETKCL